MRINTPFYIPEKGAKIKLQYRLANCFGFCGSGMSESLLVMEGCRIQQLKSTIGQLPEEIEPKSKILTCTDTNLASHPKFLGTDSSLHECVLRKV